VFLSSLASVGSMVSGPDVWAAEPKIKPPVSTFTPEPVVRDVEVGRQYGAGTRVRSPQSGVSFVIPSEWSGGVPEGGEVFLLGSQTRSGMGLISALHDMTAQEIAGQLDEPQVLDDTLTLHPVGSAVMVGNQVTASYRSGELIGHAVALVGPANVALLYLYLGPKDHTGYYRRLLDGLVASTQFVPVDVGAVVKQWQGLLGGMMLKTFSTYSDGQSGGMAASSTWHFCRTGEFAYAHESSIVVEGMSSGGQEHRQGRWRIDVRGTQPMLILTDDEGRVTTHGLGFDGKATFVDKEKVHRVASEVCP
jgi:hypothetical protein